MQIPLIVQRFLLVFKKRSRSVCPCNICVRACFLSSSCFSQKGHERQYKHASLYAEYLCMFCKISEAVCFISVGRSFCMTLFYLFLLTTTKKIRGYNVCLWI